MDHPLGQSVFDRPASEAGLQRLECERPARQWALLLARSVVVGLLYYALEAATLKLRLSTSTLALLWPANALVVGTLVLSPKRHWWVYLVAIIPPHILAVYPYSVSLWWMTYQLVYNAALAIPCAAILQKFGDEALHFEKLNDVIGFLIVSIFVPGMVGLAVIYPVVRLAPSSVLSAHHWSSDLIDVWTSRWINVTASLIIFVPTILVCVTRGGHWLRGLSPLKAAEGTLLTLSLLAITFQVYGRVYLVGEVPPSIYLIPLPILLWAAIRFGSVGTCLSITALVCVSSWCAYMGEGPFLRSISISRVTILQVGWVMFSAPLLCLTAVVSERKVALEDLKRAHAELQQFTPRLISAQEKEKQRIARDLHDDIGQRLALLRIGLDTLNQITPLENAAQHAQMRSLLTQLDDLALDVHNISHQLHSSKLELLGLGAALKGVCRQLADQYGIVIDLKTQKLPETLPEELALCFYRTAQEGIMNALKHSESRRIDVSLDCREHILRMRIKDFGIGFAPSAFGNGLGLVTMQERLKMVGGVLRVNSVPGKGTELEAEAKIRDATPEAAA
jgi:two-component system sensor histidine kinase UhpB